jgi:putative hydrolase of the HAD superfamily
MMKYVLFDIDDTLFPSTEFSALARRNAINAMIGLGLKVDYEHAISRLSAIIEKKGSNYEHHFDDLCRELKAERPARYVAAAVAAYHDTKTAILPFPTVPLTLLKLRQKGFRLYVATNGDPVKQWDKLIRLRIALYFDDVFVSEELGMEKGREFYQKLLKRLDAKPRDCVMVGDREDADIRPAKSVGMATVRILSGRYASVPSDADFVIKDMAELVSIVESL